MSKRHVCKSLNEAEEEAFFYGLSYHSLSHVGANSVVSQKETVTLSLGLAKIKYGCMYGCKYG